jgi:hypothetical protein
MIKMNPTKYLAGLAVALLLSACGGGSPSGASGGTGSTGGTSIVGSAETLLTAQLKDTATGATVQSVAAGGSTEIVATLKTKDGKPVPGQVISVNSGDSSRLLFYPNGSSATTDVNGVVKIKVARANLFEFGSEFLFLIFESTDQFSQALSGIIRYSVDPPPLQLEFRDASNAVTNTIASAGLASLNVTLRFPDGTPVKQKLIDVTGDLTKIAFPEGGSQLTNDAGVAVIKVSRASASVGGAGTLQAAASITGIGAAGFSVDTVVTGTIDYSLGAVVGAATLALDTLNTGAGALPAYGTRQISVRAMLGANFAPSVRVNFSSNCGQISPATVTTNANGTASTSFTATDIAGTTPSSLGCGGKTIDVSASAVGANTANGIINVTAAPATNLSFVVPTDPTKARIYLANSGGSMQTPVEFLLINSREEPLPNQDVVLTLKTVNGGLPNATFGTVANVSPLTLTTDSAGKVTVPVFSGSVPTNVVVNAALVSNTAIKTDSSVIAIASGRPVQARVTLGAGQTAIRGFNLNGSETTVTMSLADRQGNPVPDGTAINFVTEGGVMIPPTCVTGGVPGNSQCTVSIRTQNPRPADGLVSILAYAAGEEDFVDANFNNVFDCGELYTDLVTAYRDDNDTGRGAISPTLGVRNAFVTGQFSVPRSASASLCGTGVQASPTLGDGVWGAADVRRQVVVVFSTDQSVINGPVWTIAPDTQWSNVRIATGLVVSIQDLNGNSVPTGSTILVSAIDNSTRLPADGATPPRFGSCELVSQSNAAVPDSLDPLPLSLTLKTCVAGDQVNVTVTTPAAAQTFTFTVPQ